ncbi:MAG: Fe-S oxidoreductase [Leptospiraceae bacterium]|nr:MAG: Fe-S oxidoreductase [Leptospiraceae bacterium]
MNLLHNKIGLFVPCYMDLLYPDNTLKTLKFLEHLNLNINFLYDQTCCGQPFFNSGETDKGITYMEKFISILDSYDYIITLAGSCTSMIKNHYLDFINDSSIHNLLKNKVYEFTEFLYDIYKIHKSKLNFVNHKKIGILYSCHGLRELELAKSQELNLKQIPDKVREIINKIQGIEIVDIDFWDECCGFGGTFSYYENDLSVKIGKDLLNKFIDKNIYHIIGYDLSCLTHLKTIANYNKKVVNFYYIGEFLYDSLTFINE